MIIDTPEKYEQLQARRQRTKLRKGHYYCQEPNCGKQHHPNDHEPCAPAIRQSLYIGEGMKPNHKARAIDINSIFPVLRGF